MRYVQSGPPAIQGWHSRLPVGEDRPDRPQDDGAAHSGCSAAAPPAAAPSSRYGTHRPAADNDRRSDNPVVDPPDRAAPLESASDSGSRYSLAAPAASARV